MSHPKRTFLESLNDAAQGFVYVVRHEKNMRVHFLFAGLVLIFAMLLGVSRLEWMILCLVCGFVLTAEMVNTAVEELIDFLHKDHHPSIRTVKHICAGTVLVATIVSIVVGYFIFIKYLSFPLDLIIRHIRYSSAQVTMASMLFVLFGIIGTKAFFHSGSPFRGGLISGHSAFAFSLWTSVVFSQSNLYVNIASFWLAFFVARSRVTAKIHSKRQVIFGALFGVLVTSLFYKLFYFSGYRS